MPESVRGYRRNPLSDLPGAEDVIDTAGSHGVLRHLVDQGRLVLGVSDAAVSFDGNEAIRAVTIITGQHHRRGPGFAVDGQRMQEAVERFVPARSLGARGHLQPPFDDGELGIRRNGVDAIGLNELTIFGNGDRHRRDPR